MSLDLTSTVVSEIWLAYGLMGLKVLTAYLLVTCRLLGLFLLTPGFNSAALPLHLRCLLLLVMAGVITPNVSPDLHAPGPAAVERLAEAGVAPIRTASHEDLGSTGAIPVDRSARGKFRRTTVTGLLSRFVQLAGTELCLGLLLGLCANLIIQGCRMAGQLIDQQTGLGIVAVTAIDGDDGGSVTSELLFWLGTVMLFVLGGHLLLISTLLGTFRTIPVGSGELQVEWLSLISGLGQLAITLALQFSAPVLAIQVLAGIVLSHANILAPQYQNTATGSTIRVVLALAVLCCTITGLADRLLDLIPAGIQMAAAAWSP